MRIEVVFDISIEWACIANFNRWLLFLSCFASHLLFTEHGQKQFYIPTQTPSTLKSSEPYLKRREAK